MTNYIGSVVTTVVSLAIMASGDSCDADATVFVWGPDEFW